MHSMVSYNVHELFTILNFYCTTYLNKFYWYINYSCHNNILNTPTNIAQCYIGIFGLDRTLLLLHYLFIR